MERDMIKVRFWAIPVSKNEIKPYQFVIKMKKEVLTG